jgi:hypothetical protein
LAALAVASSAAWSRVGRLFLLIHAALYLLAAALVSGAAGYDLREVMAGAGPPWPPPTPAMLVVAGVGRHARFREWDWLVYPLLVGIGVKVVAQDFMHGRPATLFVALALYGAALIMAPRVRRRQA